MYLACAVSVLSERVVRRFLMFTDLGPGVIGLKYSELRILLRCSGVNLLLYEK